MSDTPHLSKPEVMRLLTSTGEAQQELFARAREARRKHLGDEVVLRGLIEISSYCQKKCDYCAMRAPNRDLERYRMPAEEVLEIAEDIKAHGISTAFLQAGQDPHHDPLLEKVIPIIKRDLKMNVLLCLGERPRKVYERWVQLGADSYILKFEASNPQLYRDIIHAPIEPRLRCLRWIQEVGMRLGTGNIVGLPGQTLDHLVDDILFGYSLKPSFISSAPFIPNEDTPLEESPTGAVNLTLNTMAIWRVLLGDPLIPTVSPLEKIQKGGQLRGLNAGANVITINFTPDRFREKYAIYSKKRFVVSLEHAYRTIEQAGLRVSGPRMASAAYAALAGQAATEGDHAGCRGEDVERSSRREALPLLLSHAGSGVAGEQGAGGAPHKACADHR